MEMKIIGHRGARGLAPENTLASFRAALKHNVDMIEMDLRVTKDGVVVLHHDPDLVDQAGNKLNIAETKYIELLLHKPDLATFLDAAKTIKHKVPIYVEIKPGVPVRPILSVIDALTSKKWKLGEFYFASFDQGILREVKKALPKAQLIVIEKWSGVRAGRRARELATKTVCMNQIWLWWGFIKSVRRSGWTLYAYTLNDTQKAHRWSKHGLAGVVTDYPDRFEQQGL